MYSELERRKKIGNLNVSSSVSLKEYNFKENTKIETSESVHNLNFEETQFFSNTIIDLNYENEKELLKIEGENVLIEYERKQKISLRIGRNCRLASRILLSYPVPKKVSR